MMLLNPFVHRAPAAGNLVAILDAANAASWSGSGAWANIVASPADGADQTDYDFNPAGGGNAPTFNGTVGGGSSAEYWALDGADFFGLPGIAADMTAFLKGLHKAGSKFTIEIWMLWTGTESFGICPLFDSGTSDQGGADMSRGAMYVDLGNSVSTRGHSIRIKRDSGAASALSKTADAAISSGVVHMLAVSVDGTGAENSFFYKDGNYDQSGGVDTWDGTFSSPGSTDPDNVARLACRGDTTQYAPSGTRLAILRVYNINKSKAELDTTWDATRPRFGL